MMERVFDVVRQLVAEDKYVVGEHASERLEERGIMEWQVVAVLKDSELIADRPDALPNPAVEVRVVFAGWHGIQGRLVLSSAERCR